MTNDDVAVQDSLYTAGRPRRRHHGARGEDLRRRGRGGPVARRGRRALPEGQRQGRSMGMALTPCITPGVGRAELRARRRRDGDRDRHPRRAGPHREKLAPASEIVERLADGDRRGPAVRVRRPVLAFVNGMGGTPLIELYIVYRELNRFLDGRGITIERSLIGNYITSLEMAGCSITLLKLDDELTRLWDAPVDTPALRWGGMSIDRRERAGLDRRLRRADRRARGQDLTELDTAIGDGDHGTNMDRGMRGGGEAGGRPTATTSARCSRRSGWRSCPRSAARRAALRDAVPPDGHGEHGAPSSTSGAGPTRSRPASRACRRAARPSRRTRR